MRNVFAYLLLPIISTILSAQAQEITPNLKFGKPTKEELTMTGYAPDSSATAVVLYKQTRAEYQWAVDDFRVVYYHKTKIKILKDEGTSYANVSIPYYESKKTRLSKETISGLDACSYNLEGDKIVRTKMKREQVFEERVNDSYLLQKFTIPQVKAGSVIEYEYQILSDFYYEIREWKAQEDIPTLYTEYDIQIPEYFRFSVEMHGTEQLESVQESGNMSFTIQGQLLQCSASNKNFKGRQLPAIKADKYIWCTDNYHTQVNFELQAIEFPGMLTKRFTQTWEDIDKLMIDDENFGGRLKMSNPLKEEQAALNIGALKSTHEKIAALFTLLKSKLKWNERYAFYGKSGRQVLKEGTGNNADLNFVLISMLREAGLQAHPVVMSRRDQPMIPFAHPSIQKLTTFVVGIADTDSTYAFIDASVQDGFINVLPPVLMSSRARMVIPGQSLWVDLQNLSRNLVRSNIKATLAADGTLTGSKATNYTGQRAASLRNMFKEAQDSTAFIKKRAGQENVEIKSYTSSGMGRFSPVVQETLTFEKKTTVNDSFIYVNPLIFLHTSEAPFKQPERKFPVEFAYPEMININITITLPEGYAIDEIPQSSKLITSDKGLSLVYLIANNGKNVTIRYTFDQSKLLFASESYNELKLFWEELAKQNNAMMILKKI